MNVLSILFIGLMGYISPVATGDGRWTVKSESQITIRGTTNIGGYSCSLDKVYSEAPLIYTLVNDVLVFSPNRLALPVKEFECNNFLVDNDFQELLQAKEHRNIFVEILELANPRQVNGKVAGKVKITILNTEKIFTITFQARHSDASNFSLTGQADLLFSDFKLVAPKRFGGMIKIDETISVYFTLNMRKE